MYERSGSQFFKTTSEIQSRPAVVDKSRSVMASLTNLGIAGVSYSLRVVLEEKAGKKISRSEFSEKISVTNFVLSDAENSISNSPKVSGTKFLER